MKPWAPLALDLDIGQSTDLTLGLGHTGNLSDETLNEILKLLHTQDVYTF